MIINLYKNYIIKKMNNKGVLTIEAAIVLPILACVMLSIFLFMRVYFVQSVVQNAVNETANELATYSYLLSATNINDNINDGFAEIESYVDNIIDSFKVEGIDEVIKEQYKIMLRNSGNEVSEKVFSEFIKVYIQNKIQTNVFENGKFAGVFIKVNDESSLINNIDFSKTKLFEQDRTIEIVAKYKVKFILPINIIPDFYIVNKAKVRCWMDEAIEIKEKTQKEQNNELTMWDSSEYRSRGTEIIEMERELLEVNGKDEGVYYKFRTIDLDKKTYKNFYGIFNTLKKGLVQASKISKKSPDINKIKYIIIVPEGSRTEISEKAFEALRVESEKYSYEVEIEIIEKYGRSKDGNSNTN